jgi:hypothetical protein
MKTNLTGIFSDLDNETYHAMTEYVSSSGLKELNKSAAHFKAYITEKREPTAALTFGSGFHALIGEPQLFDKKYVKAPRKEGFTNALFTADDLKRRCAELGIKPGKNKGETSKLILAADPKAIIWDNIIAEFELANQGKIILEAEEYDRLDGMLSSLINNKTALHLLTKGKAEQSIFWTDKATGVNCKCRPDYLRDDGIIVDLKTTEDASKRGFERAIANYSYHIQSAFYLEGVSQILNEPLSDFVHLVVEKKPPYAVGIYTLDDEAIGVAREEIKRLLALYAECKAKDEWPAYTQDIQNVSLPVYMRGGAQ